MLPLILAHYLSAMRSYKFSEPELRRLQSSKLRKVLSVADSTIPHYHRIFRRMGLSPADISDTSDLTRLPLLSKGEIIAQYPDSMMPRNRNPKVVRRSSGTSGQPLRFPMSSEALDIRHALFLRRLTVLGYRPWDRIVTLWGPSKYWRTQTGADGVERPITSLYDYPVRLFGHPIPTLKVVAAKDGNGAAEARLIAKLSPDFIFCRPSHIRRVGVEMEKLGLSARPKCIIVGNESVTPTCIRELESTFGTVVARQYGSAEFGGAGADCRFKRGMHISEDYYACEVLKGDEQVGPGESGELVLTSLNMDIMPLIRYRTGDIVELDGDGRCGCGSCHVRLRSVQGRENDGLVSVTGKRMLPLDTADRIESEFGLRDYQLIQVSLNRVVLKVGQAETMGPRQLAGLQAYLGDVTGVPVSVEIEAMAEDDFWRKARPVVSKITAAAAPVSA
jgi:phenylacetate-CoA ligase